MTSQKPSGEPLTSCNKSLNAQCLPSKCLVSHLLIPSSPSQPSPSDESSRTLTSTSDLYTAFGTLLNTSKTLITALERSDLLDRILIASSLFLFLCVVAYILKKRIIDKGLWLAFWWVKYVPKPHPRRHIPIPAGGNEGRFVAPIGPDRQEL
jgi:hypothetical protein